MTFWIAGFLVCGSGASRVGLGSLDLGLVGGGIGFQGLGLGFRVQTEGSPHDEFSSSWAVCYSLFECARRGRVGSLCRTHMSLPRAM